jgi:integral membrane protein 2B
MTGIIDIDGDRCFVMPLNRDVVLPPKNMMDLVMKLWNGMYFLILGSAKVIKKKYFTGYYEVDTRRIREHMHVVFPRVLNLAPLGSFISKECAGKPVYMLEKETKICMFDKWFHKCFLN